MGIEGKLSIYVGPPCATVLGPTAPHLLARSKGLQRWRFCVPICHLTSFMQCVSDLTVSVGGLPIARERRTVLACAFLHGSMMNAVCAFLNDICGSNDWYCPDCNNNGD